MPIIQKTLLLSLASFGVAIPQTQWEKRQASTTIPSPASTCSLQPTAGAVTCLSLYPAQRTSFCSQFVPEATSTTVVTRNPTTTITVSRFASTVFSSTDVVTNTSTVTTTSTLTQNSTATSGVSTSIINVEATSTITDFDYVCSGETSTSSTPGPSPSPGIVPRQQDDNPTRPECRESLRRYRLNYGIAAACSCVADSMSASTTVVETSTVFTGTTVTRTTTVRNNGILTSGVTTSTSIPITTLTVTSTDIRNTTVPSVITSVSTTGTSYTTITLTTPTPRPTGTFKLTITSSNGTFYGSGVNVINGSALAFTATDRSQGQDFSINSDNELVNRGLFSTVITELAPAGIPFLYWANPEDLPEGGNQRVLLVDACRGVLTTPAEGDVFALCQSNYGRLLALGTEEELDDSPVCNIVEVSLDPPFETVPGNVTTVATFASPTATDVVVTARAAMGPYYRRKV